MYGSAAYSGGF